MKRTPRRAPFRDDGPKAAARMPSGPWAGYWREMQAGWNAFETCRVPPTLGVYDGHCTVTPAP